MKKKNSPSFDFMKRTRSGLIILIVLTSFLFLSGCCTFFLADIHGSLKGDETGAGVALKAGTLPLSEKVALNGEISYDYLSFLNGNDNLFKATTQIRHSTEKSPLWFGGEVGVVRDISVYDESYWDENPAANGFTIGALAGYRLPVESLDMNVFTGLSLISFGDFMSNEQIVEPSHSTIHFRVGLEVALPFSK